MKKTVKKTRKKLSVPKVCFFCGEKKDPSFWDMGTLAKFLTERGKIVPASRSGLCLKHQRAVTTNIKHARHLALIP